VVAPPHCRACSRAGNYDGSSCLLEPVAAGELRRGRSAPAPHPAGPGLSLLVKNEAIEGPTNILDPGVQQSLLERLRSREVLELVEEMSPDDRVRLFDELPARWCAGC